MPLSKSITARIVLVLAAIAACRSSAVEPSSGIDVTLGTPALRSTIPGIMLDVPLTVVNTRADTVFFEHCSSALLQLVDGEWKLLWAQICGRSFDTPVPPGTTGTVTIVVSTAPGSHIAPFYTGRFTGSYRVVGAFRGERAALPGNGLYTSPTFTVAPRP